MRLLLVRHGQTPSNVLHRLDTGIPGPGLTELGAEQALALVGALADEDVDAVYASVQVRAQLTAAPLARARGLAVQVREGLVEVAAGDLEMRDDDESARRYLQVLFTWAAGDLDAVMPGGETGSGVLSRIDAVVAEAAASVGSAGTAVLVSHGGAIRMWVAARADVGAAFAAAHPLANTGIVVVDGDPAAGWTVRSWTGAVLGEASGGMVLDSPPAQPLTSPPVLLREDRAGAPGDSAPGAAPGDAGT